jgi:hypothetical protein
MIATLTAVMTASVTSQDRTSGLLGLIKLTDMSAGRWVTFRVCSVVAAYAAIWVLRFPFYALAVGTGADGLEIVHTEIILWTVFLTLS